ncbi:M24 family metallopeptidase [Pantoea phytobeneficialis]|uniref:Peptidase n=1 Tax=Pantoea phytobeneficialis TaxID=2052056 RepID=A0AAP9HB23_9GAMM|nr:Xaa-Pro peptidase family protein [Pantoea phytobeneficialis]MDO6407004.1 Xaa-Pro peptidase family protein [Pantoea phytobeneficialis]QGR09968.1 peptidase [Pantoea phytobeneficialis]
MIAEALSRLRAAMQQAEVDIMVVDHGELLAWLTGYTVSETLYRACLVPLNGEPWMVLRQLDEVPCRTQSPQLVVETYRDDEDPWFAVAHSLVQRGYQRARIGADFYSYGMTVHSWQQLARHLPDVQWCDLSAISDRLRSVKFPAELTALRQAAAIADATLNRIGNEVQGGWRVRDVAALAAGQFLRLGADTGETGPIVIASGDNGFLHASGHEQRLQRQDVLHVELIPKVRHYSARLMRPFIVGDISSHRAELAEQLIAIQDQQLRAMKPGVSAGEIDAIVRDTILSRGLRTDYPNVTGYALGLYTRTPRPSDFSTCFHASATWVLEADMVFHMYISAQSLAFSETVRVTPEGAERLTMLPRQLLALPE